ncbi:hypothetical protein GWI33_015647 [Rhynchophorus ferrugineus]|uniref:Uncharacterized protein n=1 Tax=Rhynchophorus ferrugineus TaxID=354439 RepID=A0A834I500_RHYFE|nr:hypothetical protein GWI33_015647 [Rhynchophorus ferrugineus]
MSNLTEDQRIFLEECLKEFSDRYSDSDMEYQEVYDEGIPSPPIIHPWYPRSRFGYRDRGNRSPDRHNYNRDRGYKQSRSPNGQGSNSYHNKKRAY